MYVQVTQQTLDSVEGDITGVFILEDAASVQQHKLIDRAIQSGDFKGKSGTSLLIPAYDSFSGKRLLLVGLGKRKELTQDKVRKASARVVAQARKLKLKHATILLPRLLDSADEAAVVAEGALMADYSFTKHTDPEHDKQQHVDTLTIAADGDVAALEQRVRKAQLVYSGVRMARNLVNEGSDVVTTLHMEKVARDMAQKHGMKITVLDEERLKQENLNLLTAVGRAGRTPPRLILLEYEGNPGSDERVALVGKTITFDTGGVNVKPENYMEEMHSDMAGGATVLGAMHAAAALGLRVNVVGVLPVAENAVSSASYKPNDVYTSYSGKTVEIKNTDAEGRLILADALAYTIKNHNPTAVIDLATLTGAAIVALGTHIIPMISNNTALSSRIFDAGQRTHERCWMLPLYEEYKDEIKSDVADVKNLGEGREAGTIAGGAFLEAFVGDTPWAHLDIAGVAHLKKQRSYNPQGGTGAGVRLLVDVLSSWNGGQQ